MRVSQGQSGHCNTTVAFQCKAGFEIAHFVIELLKFIALTFFDKLNTPILYTCLLIGINNTTRYAIYNFKYDTSRRGRKKMMNTYNQLASNGLVVSTAALNALTYAVFFIHDSKLLLSLFRQLILYAYE